MKYIFLFSFILFITFPRLALPQYDEDAPTLNAAAFLRNNIDSSYVRDKLIDIIPLRDVNAYFVLNVQAINANVFTKIDNELHVNNGASVYNIDYYSKSDNIDHVFGFGGLVTKDFLSSDSDTGETMNASSLYYAPVFKFLDGNVKISPSVILSPKFSIQSQSYSGDNVNGEFDFIMLEDGHEAKVYLDVYINGYSAGTTKENEFSETYFGHTFEMNNSDLFVRWFGQERQGTDINGLEARYRNSALTEYFASSSYTEIDAKLTEDTADFRYEGSNGLFTYGLSYIKDENISDLESGIGGAILAIGSKDDQSVFRFGFSMNYGSAFQQFATPDGVVFFIELGSNGASLSEVIDKLNNAM